jgi:hypothetical protein
MKTERFRLALRELRPSDWERFERLASIFLAADYDELRTLASPSGDAGRDAILFNPVARPSVAIQYSVSGGWDSKIRATVRRLKEKFPNQIRILVYATNQQIGAEGDDLKNDLLKREELYLDIRDLNWFLERVNTDPPREQAAEELAVAIADPFLAGEGVIRPTTRALTTTEACTGLLFLTLQWEDDTREKGLTRLSFEALVKASLNGTSSTNRRRREQVRETVAAMLPGQTREMVDRQVDSALSRLTKKTIRHWQSQDEFCLTFEEQQRLMVRLADLEVADEAFNAELRLVLLSEAGQLGVQIEGFLPSLVERVRGLVDRFLLTRGESFAQAVVTGDIRRLDLSDIREHIIAEVAEHGDNGAGGRIVDLFAATIDRMITSGKEASQVYLRRFSDSYTLFAFLRETSDVQGAVAKMFSRGEIWLDTSLILPVMAETLIDEVEERRFTSLMKAGCDAGLEMHITPGVLEEVERHLNLSVTCLDTGFSSWRGRVPFLLSAYTASGRSLGQFRSWLENFAGSKRPKDDIVHYLAEDFGVTVVGLEEESNRAGTILRSAVQQVWFGAHERRRRTDSLEVDSTNLPRLVAHDVENYLGIIERRKSETGFALGYTSWWLTLDATAFAARAVLMDLIPSPVPDSPVMSPDFFANYLALGPQRGRLSKGRERRLPVFLDRDLYELPPEILATSNTVRRESAHLPERIIVRRVRDEIEKAKRRVGPITQGGIADVERRIKEHLKRPRATRPS